MKPINQFLLDNNIRISENPCLSPDFCLDWESLKEVIAAGTGLIAHSKSAFETAAGSWILIEDASNGDHAWKLSAAGQADLLTDGFEIDDTAYFPASFENLLTLKNLIQEHNPDSTIFPNAEEPLGKSTLGIGARFTTLHWPGVDWAMSKLGISLTANQNSIPRELVYDVDVMLAGELEKVPFPFIGADVPEGHQGQSVEGMSQGCVLAKLKSGFHRKGISWSFNADHQPIGGKFDAREDALVTGCLLASYITFDLSPELTVTENSGDPGANKSYVEENVDAALVKTVKDRVGSVGLSLNEDEFNVLLAYVWPSMKKMKARDAKYREARAKAFTTETGREFLRELSIDELPGLTTPETCAIMLALCEALDMKIHFVAPAFGFQKNFPYPDNVELKGMIEKIWAITKQFDVSIGFHSGSGKSAENYQVMGEVTGGNLEIKTSGRYTYEMGVALHSSANDYDQQLWNDWYDFTKALAAEGSFSEDETEKKMARSFIVDALEKEGKDTAVFGSPETCLEALDALSPDPDHMFWFEYNFLFVMAAGGKAEKAALGSHTPAGFGQRARFYGISDEGRLKFAQGVAKYILFLAETTGLRTVDQCAAAKAKLESYETYDEFFADIG